MKKAIIIALTTIVIYSCDKIKTNKDNRVQTASTEQKKSSPNDSLKICTEIRLKDESGNTIAAVLPAKWLPGQTVRVKFLGGDNFLQSKVKQYAVEWSKYCNINFAFVTDGNAEVRVNFVNGKGSWSIIGNPSVNNSIDVNTGNPYPSSSGTTMNFGWFNSSTADDEFRRVIIHEFGHAIGCIHEHQSPATNIPWNKPAVYQYYQQTQGWSQAQVDQNIFARYSTSTTQFSAYDKLSIMHYAIPASLLTDPNAAVGWNTNLSPTDKAWSSNIYPYCPDYTNYRGRESEYLVGDWDGDHKDNIAVRRGNTLVEDIDFNGYGQRCQSYGNGDITIGGVIDQYLIGDWDGDGKDNIGVRRGNTLFLDYNFDGTADKIFSYGNGNSENEYLLGDWDGDGKDNIAVRRGGTLYLDYNFDGTADKVFGYGNGTTVIGGVVDVYYAGDWDGDGKTNIAVRRGGTMFLDYNFDVTADKVFGYGYGNSEDQYLVGDWDGDEKDNIGVRRGITLFLDTNFDGTHDITFSYGNGTK